MRKRNKLILCLLLAGLALLTIDAETTYKKPRSKQVALVGSCTVSSPLNMEFYARYFTQDAQTADHSIWLPASKWYSMPTRVGDLGGLFCISVNVPEDRVITLDALELYLFNNSWAGIKMPVGIKVTIPKDAKYLYIGNLDYTFSNYYFMINNVKLTDDFDAAQIKLNEVMRTECDLVRAPVSVIED